MSGILVVMESRGGRIARICFGSAGGWQHTGRNNRLAITAVIVGAKPKTLGRGSTGPELLDRWLTRCNIRFLSPTRLTATSLALQQLIQVSCSRPIVVFPHTYQVRDFAPRLPRILAKCLSAM